MKRIEELRDLSDDHHTALVLARRWRQAAREPSVSAEVVWREALEAFSAQLEPHFRIEERHLLPALETIGEAGLAEGIRGDHEDLRALCSTASPDRDALEALGQRLEAHVRFEERRVFEPTQHRLSSGALRAIARACRDTPRSCPVTLENVEADSDRSGRPGPRRA